MYFFFSVYLQFGLSFFVNADQDTVLYWPVDDQYYRKNIEPTPEVCLHRNQIWIFPFTPKQNGQGNFRHATHQHPDLSKLTSSLQTHSNSIINGTAVCKVIHFTAIVRTCFENSEILGGIPPCQHRIIPEPYRTPPKSKCTNSDKKKKSKWTEMNFGIGKLRP